MKKKMLIRVQNPLLQTEANSKSTEHKEEYLDIRKKIKISLISGPRWRTTRDNNISRVT